LLESHFSIDKARIVKDNSNPEKNKKNHTLLILVLLISIPICTLQYRKTYQDHSDRKELSVDAIFSD
tara:strand:+ start:213 stop:413 length:201 start_codon:yes stop_codon:yes gene_type:complete